MAGRVAKSSARGVSSVKSAQRAALLSSILRSSVEMAPCSSCQKSGSRCLVADVESRRCSECVRLCRSFCDVFGLSPAQIEKVASQLSSAEADLEAAETERDRWDAKVKRLRVQKKLWRERMSRAISRGITDLEELEKVEEEERRAATSLSVEPSVPAESSDSFSFFGDFELSQTGLPSFLVDPGSGGGTVEQVPDNR